MCLYVKSQSICYHGLRYATKDIKCFKVLRKSLLSPYHEFQYEYDSVFETRLLASFEMSDEHAYDFCNTMEQQMKTIVHEYNGIRKARYNIYKRSPNNIYEPTVKITNGFHSYRFKLYAYSSYAYRSRVDCVVVECIIPKHSWYYVGDFGDDVCYASERIQIVRKLPECEREVCLL